MIRTAGLSLLLLLLAVPAAAQNSAYGVLGIGFPSRPTTVRNRALGDGLVMFDAFAALNPSAVGSVGRLAVAAGTLQERRTATVGGVASGALQQVRFPYAALVGRMGATRLTYSIGFSQYAERTFEVQSTGAVLLRGSPVTVTNRVSSTGAVVDMRGSLAVMVSPRWNLGASAHVLGGSARVNTVQEFSDSVYRAFDQLDDIGFSGTGFSFGAMGRPVEGLQVGLSARVNGALEQKAGDQSIGRISLPLTVAFGAEALPGPRVRLGLSGVWRAWSRADDDMPGASRAFDTWELGGGAELGGGGGLPPIRLGLRYSTLPFSPSAEQPHELVLGAGTGIAVAANRALIDVAFERVMRDGAGTSERAWQASVGVRIIP